MEDPVAQPSRHPDQLVGVELPDGVLQVGQAVSARGGRDPGGRADRPELADVHPVVQDRVDRVLPPVHLGRGEPMRDRRADLVGQAELSVGEQPRAAEPGRDRARYVETEAPRAQPGLDLPALVDDQDLLGWQP
ncbi:hypothetical protein GCM10009534_53420 [Kribbella sandramycini]